MSTLRRGLALGLVLAFAFAIAPRAAPAQDLSEDQKHKIFQAAAMTGEQDAIIAALRKIGLVNADGTPNEAFQTFIEGHGAWAEKNVEFMQEMADAGKAKAFLAQHGLATAGGAALAPGNGQTTGGGVPPGGGATAGGSSAPPPLAVSDDDAHKLFQAAAGTGDPAVALEVMRRLGLENEDGSPTEKHDKFLADHGAWAQKNLAFVQDVAAPAKAREFLKRSVPDLRSLAEVKAFKGTEDEKHRLWQAAAMTGDPVIVMDVGKRLGLYNPDGTPNPEALQRFTDEHAGWVQRNAHFVQEHGEPEKAKAYVREQLE